MKKIKAENRFGVAVEIYPQKTNRFFADQRPVSEDPPQDRLFYSCPKSESKIEFKTNDFNNASRPSNSNLSEAHSKMFNDASEKFGLTDDEYLDFYCPGCKNPVRVYFKSGTGGRHGDFLCKVTWVLEE